MAGIEISSAKDLKAWLEDKPTEVSVVLASRAALRVFPLLIKSSKYHNFDKAILLPVCRGMPLPWVAAKYPTHGKGLKVSAPAFWKSVSLDVAFLASGEGRGEDWASASSALARYRLWPNDMPKNMQRHWRDMAAYFNENKQDNWHVWKKWYEARLNGRPTLNASSAMNEEVDLAIAKIADKDWKKGPAHVNGLIAKLFAEAEGELLPDEVEDVESMPQEVPSQRPASLRPEWQNGRLTLPSDPLADDFTGGDIEQAFLSLKNSLNDFIKDLKENETNVDGRVIKRLQRMADNVPLATPAQHELISFAKYEKTLSSMVVKAHQEWSDITAAEFETLVWQFQKVVDKFPEWRSFKEEANKEPISEEAAENVHQAGEAFAKDMASEIAKEFISPIVVTAFKHVWTYLDDKLSHEAVRNYAIDSMFAAEDTVQSLSNILKPLLTDYMKGIKRGASIRLQKNVLSRLEAF